LKDGRLPAPVLYMPDPVKVLWSFWQCIFFLEKQSFQAFHLLYLAVMAGLNQKS